MVLVSTSGARSLSRAEIPLERSVEKVRRISSGGLASEEAEQVDILGAPGCRSLRRRRCCWGAEIHTKQVRAQGRGGRRRGRGIGGGEAEQVARLYCWCRRWCCHELRSVVAKLHPEPGINGLTLLCRGRDRSLAGTQSLWRPQGTPHADAEELVLSGGDVPLILAISGAQFVDGQVNRWRPAELVEVQLHPGEDAPAHRPLHDVEELGNAPDAQSVHLVC
mmetsp:Transcript_20670/g.44017  ORF Transcript_20670/g.44017 Transcript_20670/m.44017 type:complete len:221 (-) Transcript_20670:663-1325(-)